jgi:hypothetical protein
MEAAIRKPFHAGLVCVPGQGGKIACALRRRLDSAEVHRPHTVRIASGERIDLVRGSVHDSDGNWSRVYTLEAWLTNVEADPRVAASTTVELPDLAAPPT